MKDRKLLLIRLITMLIISGLFYYLFLPPINVSDPSFWSFLLTLGIIYVLLVLFTESERKVVLVGTSLIPNHIKYLISGGVVVFGIIILVNMVFMPLFNSKSYANRIMINEDVVFSEDIQEVDFNSIPLLDKTSSRKLGDRVMGEMSDLVSQFYVSDLYTQINYNNEIVRVTPLEYDGVIKYFTNRTDGVKGYIVVNSVNGEVSLTRLDKGMKYMPSAMFNENLKRKLRFSYPTVIFGEESFELDNEGNPYWVVPTIKYSGVGLRKEITGVVILDPITGESKKYSLEEVPTWVDHVFSADLILEQVNDWGKYKRGYFNSIFGQKEVVATTVGYNYVVMNDDVYLYTGITSVVSDESNLGFILCNMRTKETSYYSVPGAEEYSAMDSAKGQVQQMNYEATFPLLINLKGRPTYLISLKDKAGLVKMYAFVDVQDYQKVVVTESSKGIEQAAKNYLTNVKVEVSEDKLTTKQIKIKMISTVLIDGNTYYYILDTEDRRYKASIKVNEALLPFVRVNDKVTVSYTIESDVIEIVKVEK